MYDDIAKSVEILKSGGTILYPTDTIWGIGCDATNSTAIDKIYKLKQREQSKSMIILLDTDAKLSQYVDEVPDVAYVCEGFCVVSVFPSPKVQSQFVAPVLASVKSTERLLVKNKKSAVGLCCK